jgi:hypothetical protein
MKKISYIVTDRRTKNAVIRKICKEKSIDNSDFAIYCNENFDYMEYDNEISITLLSTTYKGIKYTFEYFSGCFNAYMVANVIDYTYKTNEYDHYIMVDNQGNEVYKVAGWQINYNETNLYNKFLKSL